MTPERITLDALLTGRAVAYSRPGSMSAIAKAPRTGSLQVGPLGLLEDEQGDLRVHGGTEKAIHHYPREHYAAWAAELGPHALLEQPGAFGENFSSHGWTEQNVCLGDRVRVGSVLLEVSQGRMPCWKLNDRFAVKDMSLRVQQSGRTGWYYRVLEAGSLSAGDVLQQVERPFEQWPLSRLSAVLFSREVAVEEIRLCLELPLVPSWRRTLERRVEQAAVEDWGPRLLGTARVDEESAR
ncbi:MULTISPECIES: MOSC domain-containing protein [Pseudomonas]|uniref:MOSC domain-containing protein n=1 Tax=Pseudomonas TaxID=286 RepID=UPI000B3542AA|nr:MULTISPECIES: MOSC domain-containing protein [Pseudomonas]PMY66423.1 cyclic pyranopterin monophosphate synthase MoaC/MOSC-domain-containing protein [Pseudomonas sp. FW305-25]PMY73586.1 cyclic pyranopterin monophosphate synthase MoaC/MOSC-domain-containing protein [Pseudomonas sp. FW126-L8]PNA80500.1 cyclic pyranopterin monophosphate synthase MoaC/MOSC-domain-containing protein [Pseudomonas sp. FW305-76]